MRCQNEDVFIWSVSLLHNNSSPERVSWHPNEPPYVCHCYTRMTNFRWIHLHFDLSPIFSDFAISKKFLIKKVGSIPWVSLHNWPVNILRYPLVYTIVIQKCQASDKYLFILASHLFFTILRFLRNFLQKSRLNPTGYSSEPDSKRSEVPFYIYHCFTKVESFG